MSWINRFTNLFRGTRVIRELDEEMAAHLEEAFAHGRSSTDARRAFGSPLQYRERSRDLRLLPWLDSLAADVVFGWRQLKRNRSASAAAILSLALAIGATTAAFRLVDAVLWRKLPVAEPDRLHFFVRTHLDREGHPDYSDDFSYPDYRRHRALIGDRADVMVIGDSFRVDISFAGTAETEKAYRQHVSGNVFGVFGLQPSAGRLLTPNDDVTPGAHPVAALSYDYWTRRFARDPSITGKTFRMGSVRYQIVGVGPKGFTGTRPGVVTDVFIPAIMNTEALDRPGWSWFQLWVRPKPGFTPEQVRQPLAASFAAELQEQLKRFDSDTPQQTIREHLSRGMQLLPAGSGASGLQKSYRQPLLILGVLVALVLMIACANTGNLLTAQATARSREMALRVSIGAGQWRLVQMVLVESVMLAAIASAAGMLFAWWSAPFVVSMLAPPTDPVRLVLDPDWRAIAFAVALTLGVALLFGLAPALRASAVKPMAALKGGSDPHNAPPSHAHPGRDPDGLLRPRAIRRWTLRFHIRPPQPPPTRLFARPRTPGSDRRHRPASSGPLATSPRCRIGGNVRLVPAERQYLDQHRTIRRQGTRLPAAIFPGRLSGIPRNHAHRPGRRPGLPRRRRAAEND
jgi:hypothetical protein